DRFLAFWFRYIPRHRSAIELGLSRRVVEAVRRDFEANVMPGVWEEALAAIVGRMVQNGELGVTPTRMGPWWHRGMEIDLVALDETLEPTRLLVAEAKWAALTATEARRELDKLRAKAQHLPVKPSEIIYLLAVRELEGEPATLPDEHIITLEDYEQLSREACRQG
ncbi:MAG TPA: DUF234 domain-containing protein, partial [Pyrodictium sp.]|nr:DUF234 domain-containing protein [Pyrodictium sp.]